MTVPAKVSAPLTIDEKGRLVIPADIRKALGGIEEPIEFYVGSLPGKSYLSLHPSEYHSQFMQELEHEFADDEQSSIIAMCFTQSTCDKVGRITIPQELRDEAKITDRVVVVNKNRHFEIWSSEVKEARKAELKDSAEFKAKVKSAAQSVIERLAQRTAGGSGVGTKAP